MSGATGRAALTFAGQVVGSYFGPVGAAVGGVVGSYVGWLIWPEYINNQGPRLNDLRVMGSAYGTALPSIYGAMRVGGLLMWAAPIRETATTSDVGGKGGPEVTQTSYTYNADFAIAVHDGPIIGISRVWINGVLRFDMRDSASQGAIYASSALSSVMAIYHGSETQLPDPVIEAALGIGNAPAYRGVSYLVFHNLDVTSFGGIPNIEVEVITAGTIDSVKKVGEAVITNSVDGSTYPLIFGVDGTIRLGYRDGTRAAVYDLDFNLVAQESFTGLERAYPRWGWPSAPDGLTGVWSMVGGQWLRATNAFSYHSTFGSGDVKIQLGFPNAVAFAGRKVQVLLPAADYYYGITVAPDRRHMIVLGRNGGSTGDPANRWWIVRYNGSNLSVIRNGTIDTTNSIGDFTGTQGSGYYHAAMLESNLTHLWFGSTAGSSVALWEIGSDNVMRMVWSQYIATITSFGPLAMYCDRGMCWLTSSSRMYAFTRNATNADPSMTLATVVGDILQKAGYDSVDYDVAALSSDLVAGYGISRKASARANLEPLQRAYWFDLVESQGKIKAIKRGGNSVATISVDDLILLDAPGADAPVPAHVSRAADAPNEVSVIYYAEGSDYQQGAQSERRVTAVSEQSVSVELPLVLSDDRAKQAAKVLLYDAWMERSTRRIATTRKWAAVEPGDVVTVQDGDAQYVVRVASRRDSGARIDFDVVDSAAALYSPNAVGGSVGGGQTVAAPAGPTKFVPLDIPLLRDVDDYPGYYVALCGYVSGWTGAKVYESADGGVNYQGILVGSTAGTVGTCVTTLGNYLGPNALDESSVLDVDLVSGTLSSATMSQLLSDPLLNAAAVGNEIIRFRSAVFQSGKTWRLTGLMRGQRGTDRLMALHQPYESFVLLSSSALLRQANALSAIGYSRIYKAVTFGASILEATAQTFTDGGAAIKPYSPVNLRAWRVPGGSDIAMDWVRRDRVSNDWLDGADIPMSESVQAYEVDLIDASGTVVRTLSGLTTPAAMYTAAQQATDFGATQSVARMRVYQLSNRVGRGFAGVAEITV